MTALDFAVIQNGDERVALNQKAGKAECEALLRAAIKAAEVQ